MAVAAPLGQRIPAESELGVGGAIDVGVATDGAAELNCALAEGDASEDTEEVEVEVARDTGKGPPTRPLEVAVGV